MGKTLIKVECVDQRLLVSSGPIIASGGRNEDEIEFSFCPLWDGFEKTAVFHREKDRAYHAAITDDRCVIPHEVLIDEGWMYLGVMGVKGDITRTSEILKYRITEGAITEGTKPSDPTPNIYEQILAQLSTVNKRLDQIGGASLDPQPFEVTGKLVQLDNFEGMPMNAVTRIEPVQAGSGDPYPGGGGKNLVSESSAKGALSAYTKVLHIKSELMPNTTYTLSFVASQAGNNLYLNEHISARQYLTTTGKLQSITFTTAEEVAKNNAAQYDTELGWIVFKNGITNVEPVTFSDVQLELGSTATAYVPYANIRPISGHTGAKLTKCGKNLISRPYIDAQKTENGITINVNDDGSISAKGTPNAQTRFTLVDKFTLLPGTYTLSGTDKASTGHVDIQVFDPSYNLLASVNNYGKTANTFTITEATAVKINIYFGAGNAAEWTWIRPQLELGSVVTAYEPYQGETFTANFGQNVYGGTLDWGKGVLTVDRAIVTLTGTENSVERNTTENAHYIRYNYFGLTQSAIADGAFCSHFKTRLNTDVGDQLTNTFEIHSSILYPIFRVSASLYPTDDVWKSYLAAQKAAGTPVQVCYKLATPTTIQLTPAQLTALQGMNNIFCDAGETTVSGRKDILWLTSHLIERINALESAIISTGGNV